jgi:1,4-alpha-glucan branching enzyme
MIENFLLSLHRLGYRLWTHWQRLAGRVRSPTRAGMGATPHAGGVTFRVWAPHADLVSVVGPFNEWSRLRHPLLPQGNGVWAADVPEARIGDAYKFLLRRRRQILLRTDPYAREIRGPYRDGVARSLVFDRPADNYEPPRREDLVIYELHVGTFNPPGGRPPGDFPEVIDRLPYLRDLGVTAIELMPVAEFAGNYSWGYNPSHPFAVSRVYGGPDGLADLVVAAHAAGIAVILDVVYNHFGPQDLDLWRFDGWYQNSLGGLYFYNDWRAHTPWGDTRPDYGRLEVRRYIQDNALMWLDAFGIDGLRWDATAYIRNVYGHEGDGGSDIPEGWQLMRDVNEAMREREPVRFSIAEDMRDNAWLAKPSAEGGAGFDLQWDERFVHPVRAALITPQDEARDLDAVRAAITATYDGSAWQRVIYTESHDEVANGRARVPEEIAPGAADGLFARKRAALGLVLTFTTPGVPMLFQGQELGEDGWFSDQRAVDWGKLRRHAGMHRLTRALIALRRDLAGETAGLQGEHVNVFHLDRAAGILAYHRWARGGPGDDVIVALNFTRRVVIDHTIGLPRDGVWRVRLNGDDRVYGSDFGGVRCPDPVAEDVPADGLAYRGAVTLGAYGFVVLSQARS